jgi:hypothetical protein
MLLEGNKVGFSQPIQMRFNKLIAGVRGYGGQREASSIATAGRAVREIGGRGRSGGTSLGGKAAGNHGAQPLV